MGATRARRLGVEHSGVDEEGADDGGVDVGQVLFVEFVAEALVDPWGTGGAVTAGVLDLE